MPNPFWLTLPVTPPRTHLVLVVLTLILVTHPSTPCLVPPAIVIAPTTPPTKMLTNSDKMVIFEACIISHKSVWKYFPCSNRSSTKIKYSDVFGPCLMGSVAPLKPSFMGHSTWKCKNLLQLQIKLLLAHTWGNYAFLGILWFE